MTDAHTQTDRQTDRRQRSLHAMAIAMGQIIITPTISNSPTHDAVKHYNVGGKSV